MSEKSSQQLPSSGTESPLATEWYKVFLPSMLTISQLAEFKEQLNQHLGHRVQLYGAKVERVDTAALQLLLAFINHQEVTIGWVEPSSELCTAARLLGLSSQLGLPSTKTTKS